MKLSLIAAVKRILRYLQGTVDHVLTCIPSNTELRAFSDEDWAGRSMYKKETMIN